MTKLKKSFTKTLAIILSALMLICVLPMQTFATEYRNYQTLTTIDIEPEPDLIIQNEVIEERTANSKTYLLEDGTYCDLTTSVPIHTYEDGEWSDIQTASEQPETIDEAMAQLSAVPTTVNTSVDDGLIVADSDKPVNIWGINSTGFTVGTATLTQSSLGLLKVNIDSKDLYNKTEVTIKADLRLSCNSTLSEKTISVKLMQNDWNINTVQYSDLIRKIKKAPIIDYNSIDSSGRYVWDITSEYVKWENGTLPNFGLALTTDKPNTTIYNGIFSRQYRIVDDNDLGFTYHNVDMGRAGTLFINDYTNVPYLVRDEIGLEGNILPVFISRFINPAVTNDSFGAGGRWNYESKLSKNGDTFIWDMFNGSSSRFQRAIPIETDSVGREKWIEYQYNAQGYTLWIDTTKSRDYDYSDNIIVDESGNTYTFTYYGFVSSLISGANENNILTITYNGETITEITDGIGRKFKFDYETIGNYSAVTKISAFSATGTPISITTNDLDEQNLPISNPIEICFEYQTINDNLYLTKVIYSDGEIVEYTYDGIGRLVGIKNIDDSILELVYAIPVNTISQNISPIYAYRVKQYVKKCVNANDEYTVDFTVNIDARTPYHREFNKINHLGKEVFWEKLQFNRNFDLLYMTDYSSNSFYADYDDAHNLLSLVIPEPKEKNNLLINGNMEIPSTTDYPDQWLSDSASSNFETLGLDDDPYVNAYVKFHNSIDKTLILKQTITNVNGKKGDKYVVSSWGKGEATIPRENHFWGIQIFAKDANENILPIHKMAFDTSMWLEEQIRCTAFSLPFDTDEITVELISNEQLGNVYFDDVYLYKTESAYVAAVDDVEEKVCKCEGCEYPFCTCKCASKDECNCVSCNIKTSYTNDSHGNPLETKTTNGLTNILSKNEYTPDGNYLSKYIDENNVATSYEYSLTNGLLLSEKLANDNTISYGYDAIGMLKSVSQDVTNVLTGDAVTMNTEYSYENDKIKSISHNGFSYTYDYDIYGNVQSINVGETQLVSYEYNNDYFGNISKITYANGDEIIYSYDNKDNIIGIKFNDDSDWRYTYTYDEYNQLKSFTDNVSKRVTTYNKTIDGIKYVEVVETLGENSKVIYGITEENKGQYTQSVFGKDYSIKTETQYDSTTSNTVTNKTAGTVVFGADGQIENICTKDAFERIVSDYMTMHANTETETVPFGVSLSLKNEYTYKNASDNQTTRLVDTFTSTVYWESETETKILRSVSLKYDYDEAGRITMISVPENPNNPTTYTPVNIYKYDEAGQLVTEANATLNTVCSYTYDTGGNITSKNYHDNAQFNDKTNTFELGEPTQTIKYEYDSVWKDKLISYNGTQIDYDAFGNPLKYTATSFNDRAINMDLEWNGRLLTSATAVDGSKRYEYSYDAAGLRTEKTVFNGQTVSKEVIDESGNKTTVDEHIFLPQAKFEYIWSNNMPVGYKITLYESSTDENGNQTAQTNEKSSFIVNVMYNENGEALGVNCHSELEGEENSLTFLFVKDAQGNIVSISACEGEYFFDFVYDAFGNVKMDITGEAIDKIQETINSMDSEIEKLLYSLASGLGLAVVTGITFACVPNAYRGYIYDMETGLYYCQSRYYSPEWGRFINADDTSLLELTTGNIHGANLFAYCNNDPVNNFDPSGYYYISIGNLSKIFLYVVGFNPIGTVLASIGLYKLKTYIVAKMALLGLRIGKFWGPVVCSIITGLFAVSGIYVGGQIAQALWDCAWQGKRGVEFTVKRNRWGHPYAIDIYAR